MQSSALSPPDYPIDQSHLAWDHWFVTRHLKEHMQTFRLGGWNYYEIFEASMRRLFFDEVGLAGRFYVSPYAIYNASVECVRRHGYRYKYSASAHRRLLRHGRFKFRENFPPKLGFRAVELNTEIGISARAYTNDHWIYLHTEHFVHYAREFSYGDDATGVDRMIERMAGVVLHEIMHCHGLEHPEKVQRGWGNDYSASLPEVAEWSVYLTSRHSEFLMEHYALNPSLELRCGCPSCADFDRDSLERVAKKRQELEAQVVAENVSWLEAHR